MKKNVVLLSAFLSPFRSGAEAMVEEVSSRLSKAHDITIITARFSRRLPMIDVLPGTDVRVIRVGLGMKIDKYLFPLLAVHRAASFKPDIVHAVLESYAGLALVFVKRLYPKAKRILTLQSTNTALFLKTIHRIPHAITAISQALVVRAKILGREDVRLIRNGIDLKAIHDAQQFHTKMQGRILYVGRLEPMKGVDTLIHAFHQLVHFEAKGLDTHLLHLRIAGDGSQRAKLKRLVTRLHLQKHVLFLGRVSPAAIFDEYAQAQVFCGLSRSEALGNVFLEAQASGCAVIGTRVGGIPEIVKHEHTGLLVGSDDAQAAAEAMARVFTDKTLSDNIIDSGRHHAKAFDWDVIAIEYGKVYETI